MNAPKIRFDGWVLDRESGDLSRAGVRQRLQELPLKVLDLLVANPGGVVTREQLIAHLWPKGIVDFDTGINTAVRKLRAALGDLADTPRYIETLPRRGYRFIGTLESPEPPAVESSSGPARWVEGADSPPDPSALPSPSAGPPPTALIADPPAAAPLTPVAPVVHEPARGARRRAWAIGAAAALVLAVVLVTGIAYRSLKHAGVPAATDSNATATSPAAALPTRSVAVLPFENLSAEPNNEFLALGIAEMVLHRLADLKDLTVIARTSSFVFKNRDEDARDIGRKLNARYLVEGSVQHEGARLRVTTELIDASSGNRVWSLSFDRQLTDIFALQDEIAGKVANALSVSLTAGAERGAEPRTSKLEAYLAYLQGRALAGNYRAADAEAAIRHFARAIEIDPGFAAAYAEEARAIGETMSLRGQTDPAASARGRVLNDKALELDPDLGEAWVARAEMRAPDKKEERAIAEKEFRKGLALAPNFGDGFAAFAEFLYNNNRLDEALAMIDRARQVDPLAARNHYLKGLFLWFSGHSPQEAEPLFLQALKINPTYHAALARLGRIRAAQGEYAEGAVLLERALLIDPEADWVREHIVVSYLSMGDVLAAHDVLKSAGVWSKGLDLCVLAYEGNSRAGVEEAYALFGKKTAPEIAGPAERCAALAIRDDALATRRYDRALRVLEARYAVHSGSLDDDAWIAAVWGLPYARVLQAKGEVTRATKLTRAVLGALEAAAKDKPQDPNARYWLAVAQVQLGELDQAVASLQAAMHAGLHWPWWFVDHEGAFESLRGDARYQAILAELGDIARKQGEIAQEMRKRHELPDRPSSRAAIAR